MAKASAIEVKLKDTELFQKIVNLLEDIVKDDRIQSEVKQDLKNKICEIMEACVK